MIINIKYRFSEYYFKKLVISINIVWLDSKLKYPYIPISEIGFHYIITHLSNLVDGARI